MIYALALILSPFLLLLAYFVVIQFERGGWWKIMIIPSIPAFLLDVLLAHTLFPLLVLDFPRSGEWTFSDHLARLVYSDGWRGEFARYMKKVLDAMAPSGIHIVPKRPR